MKYLIWDRGKPAEFWFQHARAVREFIAKEQLAGYPEREFGPFRPQALEAAEEAPTPLLWRDWCGGLMHPHLHAKDMIYPLEMDQWKRFREARVEEIRGKLDNASSVSFPSLLDISAAVARFG